MFILFVICGYLSTVFAFITQIPQVVTIMKHRSGKNLSYPYLALIMVDCMMYVLYGIGFLLDDNYDGIPIILAGCIPFIISSLLVILKIYFTIDKKNKNKKNNEIDNHIKEICEDTENNTDTPCSDEL